MYFIPEVLQMVSFIQASIANTEFDLRAVRLWIWFITVAYSRGVKKKIKIVIAAGQSAILLVHMLMSHAGTKAYNFDDHDAPTILMFLDPQWQKLQAYYLRICFSVSLFKATWIFCTVILGLNACIFKFHWHCSFPLHSEFWSYNTLIT